MSDAMVTKGGATGVAEVEGKLNELWAGLAVGDNALLRATTLNLVVYGAVTDALINLLVQVTERHPCRAIVIDVADRSGTAITATPMLLRHPAFGREMRTQVSCGSTVARKAGSGRRRTRARTGRSSRRDSRRTTSGGSRWAWIRRTPRACTR